MIITYLEKEYNGILAIGDPHLESRTPGFRKDDYPEVILEKLRWSFNYAVKEKLLPVILGDIFHMPRNNPNRLLVKFMQILNMEVFAVYGNHDVHENEITEDDSISVISESGKLKILNNENLYLVKINNRFVMFGGTSWGEKIPDNLKIDDLNIDKEKKSDLTIWFTHHDIKAPGYEDKGYINTREILGIDIIVNGHIHRPLDEVKKGKTLWLTPGNISRRTRSDASKTRKPSILRIDIDEKSFSYRKIEAPHKPFEEIFYETIIDEEKESIGSAFITGLAELQARRTESGEGFKSFLEKNLTQFNADVSEEIKRLAKEIL